MSECPRESIGRLPRADSIYRSAAGESRHTPRRAQVQRCATRARHALDTRSARYNLPMSDQWPYVLLQRTTLGLRNPADPYTICHRYEATWNRTYEMTRLLRFDPEVHRVHPLTLHEHERRKRQQIARFLTLLSRGHEIYVIHKPNRYEPSMWQRYNLRTSMDFEEIEDLLDGTTI